MPETDLPKRAVALAQEELAAAADSVKAPQMQAYMKTDMPFYGVSRPERKPVEKRLKAELRPGSRDEYVAVVRALWDLPHREEKYLALSYARGFSKWIDPQSVPLYEALIREGAWWDLVDEIAGHLVGRCVDKAPEKMLSLMDLWIDDEDMWIWRVAIISQLKRKEHTDAARLFRYCQERAHEKEFFIRKAIGWALRQYSYVAPEAVLEFLQDNQSILSGLSKREGAKQLKRMGLEPQWD